MAHISKRKELPRLRIMSLKRVMATMPPATKAPISTTERRFQHIKLSQPMARTIATSGVLEPVATSAANMAIKPGIAINRMGARLQVMISVSQ